MKTAILLLFVVATVASATPVAQVNVPVEVPYEWTPVGEVDVAWSQGLQEDGGWALASQLASDYPFYAETADDFVCGDGSAVVAVEWWGAYWNPGAPPYATRFVIRFYANDAGARFPQPGQLVYEQTIDDYTEDVLPGEGLWYRYYCELDPPLAQQEGETYWISIQAVYSWYEGGQWGWGECVVADYWGGEAVHVFDSLGVTEWTPYSCVEPYEHRECAFVLYKDVFNPVADASWTRVKRLFR